MVVVGDWKQITRVLRASFLCQEVKEHNALLRCILSKFFGEVTFATRPTLPNANS